MLIAAQNVSYWGGNHTDWSQCPHKMLAMEYPTGTFLDAVTDYGKEPASARHCSMSAFGT